MSDAPTAKQRAVCIGVVSCITAGMLADFGLFYTPIAFCFIACCTIVYLGSDWEGGEL